MCYSYGADNNQYSWHWRQSLNGRHDGRQDGCQKTTLIVTGRVSGALLLNHENIVLLLC